MSAFLSPFFFFPESFFRECFWVLQRELLFPPCRRSQNPLNSAYVVQSANKKSSFILQDSSSSASGLNFVVRWHACPVRDGFFQSAVDATVRKLIALWRKFIYVASRLSWSASWCGEPFFNSRTLDIVCCRWTDRASDLRFFF